MVSMRQSQNSQMLRGRGGRCVLHAPLTKDDVRYTFMNGKTFSAWLPKPMMMMFKKQ